MAVSRDPDSMVSPARNRYFQTEGQLLSTVRREPVSGGKTGTDGGKATDGESLCPAHVNGDPSLTAVRSLPAELLMEFEDKRRAHLERRRAPGDAQSKTFQQVTILRLAVQFVENSPCPLPKAFAYAMYAKLSAWGELPCRDRGGTESGPWTSETLESWFRGRNSPREENLAGLLRAAIGAAEEAFVQRSRVGEELRDAIESWKDVPECFRRVFGSLLPPPDPAYRPPEGHEPLLGDTFKSDPTAIDPEPLQTQARKALDVLSAVDGPRMVIVNGPPHSGKKTVLRFFLKGLPDERLTLNDGSELPILALALDDHTSVDLIDQVYQFYSGPARLAGEVRSLVTADPQAKLDHIGVLAAKLPACVVLADVAPVDSDPIVRALAQDYIGDILVRIMRGDRRTRLLVTAPNEGSRLERDAARLGWSPTILSVDETMSFGGDRLSGMTGWMSISPGSKVRALTFTLADVAKQLIDQRCHGRRATRPQRRRVQVALQEDAPEEIAHQIWDSLLKPSERVILGMISLSHDGLRVSTMRRLLKVFKKLAPEAWCIPVAETNGSGCRIELAPILIDRLVRIGKTDVQLPLQSTLGDAQEQTCSVDDGWRRLMIRAWYSHAPKHARLGQWLIAREAAAQSRIFRTSATEGYASLGFSRDVQALSALVSSLDLNAIRPWRESGSQVSPFLESIVLPPIEDEAAALPDPTLAIRYAFLQLYQSDLNGDAFRHQALLDDATLRLSMLMPLFEPEAPWLRIKDMVLGDTLRHYRHLIQAFTPTELIDLLSSLSMAAMRIRRIDLVCASARLAESVAELPINGEFAQSCLLLPLRAEIDAGILCGGNPDAFLAERKDKRAYPTGARSRLAGGIQVSDVAARIHELLDTTFKVHGGETASADLQLARAKLTTRLGEVWHIAGDRKSANSAFQEALRVESDVSRYAVRLGPVLGGRGARSYLRLLIDQARMSGSKWPRARYRFERDGLEVPLPSPIARDNEHLVEARKIFDLNARRLGRGRAADKIGARIDAARLSALGCNFEMALSHLEAAASARFASGTSIEVLLELLAVRARIHIDAALVCLVSKDDASGVVDPRTVVQLGAFVDIDVSEPESKAIIAKELLKRAKETSEAFYRYVEPLGPHYPYFTFSTYIMAWLDILASRLAETDETRRGHLERARQNLWSARRHMYEGEYCMHFAEAGCLWRGLRNAFCSDEAASKHTG